MKATIITLMATIGFVYADISPQQTLEKKIAATYAAAVQAKNNGDYATAEKYLKAVIKASPNHGNARLTLRQIEEQKKHAKNTKSVGTINNAVIDNIDFDGTPFNEALEALARAIDNNNGDSAGAPNIVIVDPAEKLKSKEVTLKLSNVPAESVFKYILSAASATASYGEYVITVRPK